MACHRVNFSYRGLYIEALISPYQAADYYHPPEGGECEDYTFEVEDIDEVLLYLELSTEGLDELVRGYYRLYGRLPKQLKDRIKHEWDIPEEATTEFWQIS